MAYTDIDDSTINFNTVTYTGNVDHSSANGSQAITGVGFQPDWVWIKPRTLGYSAGSHNLTDSVRGAGVGLFSDLNSAEYDYGTSANGGSVITFGSDGFTLGGASQVNEDSNTYVAWNWKAGGSASSNTNGSITSTVSANTTAGFSIVSYTGTGSAATVGHGLGVAPSLYIVKNRSSAQAWRVFVSSLGADKILRLSTTHASSTDTSMWNNTSPTSSVFSIGTPAQVNTSGENYIAYCFADVKGYLKVGSYTGNGNADGPFVYTGFKPAWVLVKKTSEAREWMIWDNKRDSFNVSKAVLHPDNTAAEDSSTSYEMIDILSNGFKLRQSDTDTNQSGGTFIYMAFAESPFVNSNGIPNNAR